MVLRPDTIAMNPDSDLLFSTAQFHLMPDFTGGEDRRTPPYKVFRPMLPSLVHGPRKPWPRSSLAHRVQRGGATVGHLYRSALNCTGTVRQQGVRTMAKAPTIETMKFTDARQQLSQVVNRVARHETRVLLEKSGVPVAAIVSADDLRRLDQMEMRRQEGIRAMERISDAFADVPLDELEREVERAVAEARAELRAEREAAKAQ